MAPLPPPGEAGSRSHPPCFSAPREEKGELDDADSEELLENENNFQKEILECGQEAWQMREQGAHYRVLLVFPQPTGGGYCWVRGAVHEGREKHKDRRGFGARPRHSFMFAEVLTSLRKLEEKQILGLFTLNCCGKEVSGAGLQQRRCYKDKMVGVFSYFGNILLCHYLRHALF